MIAVKQFQNNDIFSTSSLIYPVDFVLRQSALEFVILLLPLTF